MSTEITPIGMTLAAMEKAELSVLRELANWFVEEGNVAAAGQVEYFILVNYGPGK